MIKQYTITASLLTALTVFLASNACAQVYHYVPRTSTRHRTSWYTAKPANKKSAAKTVPLPQLTPAQAAAKSALDGMAGLLDKAEGLSFDATISYPTEARGKISLQTTSASTTVERYTRLLIQTTKQGQTEGVINADGTKFTLYDASKNDYAQITTSPDLPSLERALELGGNQVFPKSTLSSRDLRSALEFPMLFLDKDFDLKSLPVGYTLNYTETSTTSDDSKPVNLITVTLSSAKTGSMAASYMIDPATDLPTEFSQIETKPGKAPVFDIQETFKNVKILRKPLPASTYVYNVPSGAAMAPAELKLSADE